MIPHRLSPAAVALTAVLLGCSYRTSEPFFEPADRPAGFTVTGSTPAEGASGVPRGTAIVVRFGDFPDPATVRAPAVSLRTGVADVPFTARVDLIDRSIIVEPTSALAADTSYQLSLSSALASLARQPLQQAISISFRTGQLPGGGLPPPPALSLAADIQPIFTDTTTGCVRPGCHDAASAQAGLVLDAAQAAAQLIGVASTEVPLQRVTPGEPASSYLLRKLVPTPDIVLSPMPIGRRLQDDRIRRISDWILGGANP